MRISVPLLAACMALTSGCSPRFFIHPSMSDVAAPGPETVDFSGLRWRVSSGRVQGDARWTACNVQLDGDALRLTLSRAAGETFLGAQVALAAGKDGAQLGYGRYEFEIDPVPRQALPPRGVFAMFSYGGPSGIDRRGVWGYNEIDIEINRSWLRTADGRATGRPPVYTVWPAVPAGRRRGPPRKPVSAHLPAPTRPDPLGEPTRHRFDWSPGSVRFSSWANGDTPFFSWAAADGEQAAGTVPSTPMSPMLNLWTVAGGLSIEKQACGPEYPCGTWTVVVRSVRLPVPIHKHSGDGQQGEPGTPLPDPLVVRVADERGRPMPGVAVEFSIQMGGGGLGGAREARILAWSGADSTARAAWTLGGAGAQGVHARVLNGTRPPVAFTAALP